MNVYLLYIFPIFTALLKVLEIKRRELPLCIIKTSSFLSHKKVLNIKVGSFSLKGSAIILSPSLAQGRALNALVLWVGGVVLNVESDQFSSVFTLGEDPFSKN